jgi:hypothetical protein
MHTSKYTHRHLRECMRRHHFMHVLESFRALVLSCVRPGHMNFFADARAYVDKHGFIMQAESLPRDGDTHGQGQGYSNATCRACMLTSIAHHYAVTHSFLLSKLYRILATYTTKMPYVKDFALSTKTYAKRAFKYSCHCRTQKKTRC